MTVPVKLHGQVKVKAMLAGKTTSQVYVEALKAYMNKDKNAVKIEEVDHADDVSMFT